MKQKKKKREEKRERVNGLSVWWKNKLEVILML
jgi:hypothetical protein